MLDVIVTSPGFSNEALLYAYTLSSGLPQLIAKAYPIGINYSEIGPPCIGDIRGTGIPYVVITRESTLQAYSFNGNIAFQMEWSMNTKDTAGFNAISMFDFNDDGKQEIVYRDETSLYVIDGSSAIPKVITNFGCFSWTWSEYPIVGDIDDTGHAKLCVPCSFVEDGQLGKLIIFGPPDSLPGWAPARGIWNQYNYHALNINDDLTVPRVQKNNATYKNGKYNNFFVQESLLDSNGMYLKRAASLSGKIKCINYDPINDEYTVIFDIYNLSNASVKADSNLPVSFYKGDPATTGSLIDIYYTLKILESGDSLLNLEFKFSVSNLTDLFMVINTTRNGSGQFDPRHFLIAECDYTDNISRTLELPKVEKINAAICEGNGYQFYDTLVYDAGMYYHKINSVTGCDSIVYLLEVTTTDSIHINQTVTTCDTYTWNGQTYFQSGTFVHDTTNSFGCDSITTLNLVINTSNTINIPQTACDSFNWNGMTYDKSGTYPYQSINSAGCDSTITLELLINKSDNIDINHTACINYTWNGQSYSQSGTYKLDTLNRFGCDSAVTLNLTINSIINVNLVDAACDSYIWNGNTYTQSGSYQFKTINQQGCDSITTLQLTINSSNNSMTSLVTCDSFTWNGQAYDQSGIYQFKTQNTVGCDSTAILQLTLNKSNYSITETTSCDSFTWNGNAYDKSGSYQYHALNAAGCDSIATLNLVINNSDHLDIKETACDSFTWNGKTFNQNGIYQYQTVNILGCDSVINLNLIINKSSKADLALSACDSLNFLGNILKANGKYTFMLQNAVGCDSVINLSLSIRSEFYNNSVTNCDTFTWNLNGQSYNQSGIYYQKYVNSFGCDSIYKLDLTINKNYDELQQAVACKEYLWQINKILFKQSGDYIYPLKTIHGCDSILRLNLIINYDFEKTDTVITDSTYTWPVNHKSYPSSGIYQEQFTSGGGCDSIRYLFLIIKKNIGIYFPNVIRPGGPNAWFTIFDNGHTISSIETLTVYDRWGDLVWQKHGILPNELKSGWDGTFNGQSVLPGVYVWHAQLLLQDGSLRTERGDVSVIR
ncbi:MAG: gliding motility-associated C-terminal domain-containing protein [Saprospiraceae bacterium]|nr:gliding motility-associated C-terminal domain-containing protein [Saprospiraceae bacterium]